MRMAQSIKYILAGLLLAFTSNLYAADENKEITIFAAASLTNAVTDIAEAYEKETQVKIKKSFASSATLAKQIENGAPADIFISADTQWMTYLKDKNALNKTSTSNLLNNRLVMIVPAGKKLHVEMSKSFNLNHALNGKLCTGEMESVPVGIYARQALTSLGWFGTIKTKIVGTQDVRAALTLVEKGECIAGIVYETDAKVSNKVEVVGVFPENTHAPIFYPISLTASNNTQATAFYDYLKSNKAKMIFMKYGFSFSAK